MNGSDKDRDALLELMEKAGDYGFEQMRTKCHCPLRMYIDGIDGNKVFRPPRNLTTKDKDDFATLARLYCVAHGAKAAVVVSEGWVLKGRSHGTSELTVAPSESQDREEMLIMLGETRQTHLQAYIQILRHADGKVKCLGQAQFINEEHAQGRFIQLVPPAIASEKDRYLAQDALEQIGNMDYYLEHCQKRKSRRRGMSM